MGLWNRIKAFFQPKEHELAAKLLLMKLHQDTHTYTLADLIDRNDKNDDFKHLVANAVANTDSRIKELEEKMDFIFKFASAQEDRIDTLEERANSEDLNNYVQNATIKSTQN